MSAENLEEDAGLTIFLRIVDSDEAFYRISVEAPDFGEVVRKSWLFRGEGQ